ncbi:MAG: 1-deoxy-D-xylulose-5-phosphate synthase [Propionibacteriaceae bacterium]
MSLLSTVAGPQDIRGMSRLQLEQLADEIREFLIKNVSKTGGHLGPNLGVVELTIALHRVFKSPQDPILFDTGHQSYVHKILTGRQAGFTNLRKGGGLSGYPCRAESEHDWVESSHASAALSWGEGMAKAFRLKEEQRTVAVLVGDGALTGGMAWEALNNIAENPDLPIVIVVNDNGRSYTPTVGGMVKELSRIRSDRRYEQTLDIVKKVVSRTPVVGGATYELLHGVKIGLKDVLAPQTLFSDLGLKYLGPIDGHDLVAVERALTQAKGFGGPVIVHCITTKGKGFAAAESNDEDRFHAVGVIDSTTGEPIATTSQPSWTDIFADEIVKIGAQRQDLVAITAAMMHPVGLGPFQQNYPERCFDVGIAEQHAVTSAAGLAMAGIHPVVAVYSTFLNRAFDQIVMDVALHKVGVTFVLDRAGVTGTDGASHNGVWDTSMLGMVPGLQLAAPRDELRLREALNHAVTVTDAPTVIRYCKEPLPPQLAAINSYHGVDVIHGDQDAEVLIVAYGPFVALGVAVIELLSKKGIPATLIDPVWALPVNEYLPIAAAQHRLVVSIEDGLVAGGLGAQLGLAMQDANVATPLRCYGVPRYFPEHDSRDSLLKSCGLTAESLTEAITQQLQQ